MDIATAMPTTDAIRQLALGCGRYAERDAATAAPGRERTSEADARLAQPGAGF